MALQTRWYMAGWATYTELGWNEPGPGVASAIFKYVPIRDGQSTGALHADGSPYGLIALTYDDTITPAPTIAADFLALEVAPAADVSHTGIDIDQPWVLVPTRAAMIAKFVAMNIDPTALPAGRTIRAVLREVARHILLFEEVGVPPGQPGETLGARAAQLIQRAEGRGFTFSTRPTISTTVGEAYGRLLATRRAGYGLNEGRVTFGRSAVTL